MYYIHTCMFYLQTCTLIHTCMFYLQTCTLIHTCMFYLQTCTLIHTCMFYLQTCTLIHMCMFYLQTCTLAYTHVYVLPTDLHHMTGAGEKEGALVTQEQLSAMEKLKVTSAFIDTLISLDVQSWVCCVALPCCLYDLACFFLSSFFISY